MKGKCKSSGGKVRENDDLAGTEKELKEGAAYKKGGMALKAKRLKKVLHKKHGGKIDGKKPHHRADKLARGGHVKHKAHGGEVDGMAKKVVSAAGMSPSSPLSGAGKTKDPMTPKIDREDD